MPQFELANFIPQLFWLAIFFAILYFGVVRLTLPKLGRVMTAREDQVLGDVDLAAKAKAEADRIAADYDAGVAKAHEDARAKVTAAQAKATAATEQALADANAKLAEQAGKADADLGKARGKALTEIEGVAADLAADLVEKLTGTRPAAGAAATVIRAAF